MTRVSSLTSSTSVAMLAALALLAVSALFAKAAIPFSEATVTRLQNKVSYGEQVGAESVTRAAAVQDVVRARNYLLTESDARAELKYPDGSIVRVGQNTVFTFEADSRTLSLSKGSFIFYVPKGQGGGIIKTPSLTAAITGTVGKVSPSMIAIVEGSLKLIPSGRVVLAGQFVRRNADGTLTIDFFNPAGALGGKLMSFNGPLPPFREDLLANGVAPDFNGLVTQETLDRTANHPSANQSFFPPIVVQPPPEAERPRTEVFVPPPTTTPRPAPSSPNGRPGGGGNNY